MNLKVSNEAQYDLIEIWEYTFKKWSQFQADKYFEILVKSFNEIAKNPYIGKSYENTRKGYLGLNVKSHIIFYKVVESSTIIIIRILHERMDLHKRISE